MNARFDRRLALFVLLLAALATQVFAQGIVTGSISGTVGDQTGATVANATVTATETQTNRKFTANTNSAGQFNLRQLPPGDYTVNVTATGFQTFDAKNVRVVVGQDTTLNSKLSVGGETQTVTVEGAAPLIETQTDQVQSTFTTKETASIPLGNTYDSFALFVPGIVTAGSASFGNNNGAELSVNGQRARSNNFQLDGQSNNDNSISGPNIFFGNQDAIAELQVITNYTAEYGRNMGSVVNYITKSGTNAFHGTAFEFNQSNAFDSLANQEKNPLFATTPSGAPVCAPGQAAGSDTASHVPCEVPSPQKFVDNRFGGTMGGPIKKDRIWFFGSGNFERQRFAGSPTASSPATTPTPQGIQQLQAAFPNSPGVAALAQFGPAAVTAGNPTFGKLITQTVTANGVSVPVQFGEITRNIPSIFNDSEATGRVDIQLTQKDRLFSRYIFQQTINTNVPFDGVAAAAGGDFVDVPGRSQQIGLDWTRTFTNNFLNQVRYSYSRARSGFEGGAFPNCVQSNFAACTPQIFLDSPNDLGFGVASGFPQGRIINNSQVQDNASWAKGRHSLKIGGDYTKQRSPSVFLPAFAGFFEFDDFNALVANTPNTTQIAFGNPKLNFKENDLAFYFQDDWRVRDNLTLNLGMRWEWFQQAMNLLHDQTVAQQTGPNPFWSTALPLDRTTIPHIPEDRNNFSPVFGFAWTPRMLPNIFGDGKTVVRGGFRIAYDPSFYNIFLNVANSAPVVNLATFASGNIPGIPVGGNNAAAVQNALGAVAPFGGDPGERDQTSIAPNFHNPYSQQWNFGIQREIGSRMAAEVRYVGNHTIGNFQTINGNPALNPLIDAGFGNLIPAGLTPCSTPNTPGFADGRVDCNRTNVLERANTAFSIYHGLQTQYKVSNWHGITFNAAYTFSKTIDNASEIFSTGTGGSTNSFAQNPFNIGQGERAQSGISYPHTLGILWIYDLPYATNQNGLLGHVLGGWQVNGTYRYTSGQPYTVVQSRVSGSLCDPTNWTVSSRDACRPIMLNAGAPFTNVGSCNPTQPGCDVIDASVFLAADDPTSPAAQVPLANAHWLINDQNAAAVFGSPFLGVGRNTERGQPISTANLSVYKNTKIGERYTLQFQATAFNVMNTQFLGIPSARVNNVTIGTFGTPKFNSNGGDTFAGNNTTDGIGRRRMQFGLKVLF
jgi:hypothetical protein